MRKRTFQVSQFGGRLNHRKLIQVKKVEVTYYYFVCGDRVSTR